MFNQLELKHPKIAKYFATGEGIKLQYIDSQIVEKVMMRLARDNIVALPVHDSFIVRMSHINDLKEEMDKAHPRNKKGGILHRFPPFETRSKPQPHIEKM